METEYLVGAWCLGASQERTPEALEALRGLVLARLGYLPPQIAAVRPELQPSDDTYHDHDTVLKWVFRLERGAWLPLVVAALALLALLSDTISMLSDFLVGGGYFEFDFIFRTNVLILIGIVIGCFSLFLLMRAGAHGLLVLMDAEANTRAGADVHAASSHET
jgi:hypothetical protein